MKICAWVCKICWRLTVPHRARYSSRVLLRSPYLWLILLVPAQPKSLGGHMSGRNGTETRRSGRVTLRVPLKIFEPNTNKRFLVEEAYSLKVSLWGGLIALRAPVNRHQKLLLVNQATGETAESQIVYLGPMHLGGRRLRLVAIEFLKPSPGFWSIGFPSAVPCRARTANHSN